MSYRVVIEWAIAPFSIKELKALKKRYSYDVDVLEAHTFDTLDAAIAYVTDYEKDFDYPIQVIKAIGEVSEAEDISCVFYSCAGVVAEHPENVNLMRELSCAAFDKLGSYDDYSVF